MRKREQTNEFVSRRDPDLPSLPRRLRAFSWRTSSRELRLQDLQRAWSEFCAFSRGRRFSRINEDEIRNADDFASLFRPFLLQHWIRECPQKTEPAAKEREDRTLSLELPRSIEEAKTDASTSYHLIHSALADGVPPSSYVCKICDQPGVSAVPSHSSLTNRADFFSSSSRSTTFETVLRRSLVLLVWRGSLNSVLLSVGVSRKYSFLLRV